MISRIAAALLLALLPGCAQYQAQQQADAAAQAQAHAASDDAQCRSYGVLPESPGYVQCRMNLSQVPLALIKTPIHTAQSV